MRNELRWFDRSFAFPEPVELYPAVICRLRGLPARVEELVHTTPGARLTRRIGEAWSIQANVGHLLDLEPLLDARIDDFLAGRGRLSAADPVNRATHEARHDERAIADLLAALRSARERICERLETLRREDFARVAIHPRLEQPMRLVDACRFVADHDDHHLVRMHELARG